MKQSKLLVLTLLLLTVLSGCIKFKTDETPQSATGGIYKSIDQGQTWTPAMLISNAQQQRITIEPTDISHITLDPQDEKAVYIATEANGMFFSYDAAQSWNQFESLSQGFVRSIAVHPKDKCTIFASINNRILRSEDCSRTWEQVYFDTRTDAIVYTIAIDSFDPMVMYAGTGYGDVLKSQDGGLSWRTVERVNARIVQILIGPDTRNVYVGTEYNGIYKTTDKGQSWSQIVNTIYDAGADPGQLTNMRFDYKNNELIISTLYGLIKSKDGGDTWESIPLLTAPSEVLINALAVNPENSQEIYYGTDTALYKTFDGGLNWITQQLPTASKVSTIHIDPENTSVIYLGFKKFQQ